MSLQLRVTDRPPILWTAVGRQRVGKTVLLNTAVQYGHGLENPIRVWNEDQQKRNHTLSVFFPDAEETCLEIVRPLSRCLSQRRARQIFFNGGSKWIPSA